MMKENKILSRNLKIDADFEFNKRGRKNAETKKVKKRAIMSHKKKNCTTHCLISEVVYCILIKSKYIICSNIILLPLLATGLYADRAMLISSCKTHIKTN